MTIARFALLTALCLPFAARADEEVLRMKEHGFSIKALKGKVTDGTAQVLLMGLQAQDGFSPNVNVQLQPYPGSIDEYLKLSKTQFTQLGFSVLTDKKLGGDTVLLEYTGTMMGKPLHWYARATKAKGRPIVYLVTGTTAAAQWAGFAATIKDCVDSFKLD